jgi:polyferredoxin
MSGGAAVTSNDFFQKNITVIRRCVQAVFGLFILYSGYCFYLFYNWAMNRGDYVVRPPAVEAFLPISALLSLKRMIFTGEFDPIHPAGLVIFMAALAIALLARKGFCGWICPVGFSSHLAQWTGKKLKIILPLPIWLDYLLSSLKYILLGFFLYIIGKMDVASITSFLETPYNLAADAKMLQFFLAPSHLASGIMIFLVLISFTVPNFWCRFLCPYGALLGLLAFFSPLQVSRNPENCIDCRKCDRQCPGRIQVSRKETIRSPECIGCLECVVVCPKKDCLNVQGPGRKKLVSWLIPFVAVVLFLGFWMTARVSDHWQSKVPPETFKQMYQLSEQVSHPKY